MIVAPFIIRRSIFICIFCGGLFCTLEVRSQELNLGFERLDLNTGIPEGWNLKINAPDLVYGVDSLVKHSGKYSFHIKQSLATEKKSNYFQLSLPCAIPKGTLVKGGFYLKTKDVKSRKQLFLTLNFDNFCGGRSPEILSSDWEQYKVKMTTFFDVKNLVLSIGFSGVGELWIDDAVLEVNGKNILVGDSLFLCEIKEVPVSLDYMISPSHPLKASEVGTMQGVLKLMDSLLMLLADSVPVHPSSVYFPGPVSEDASIVTRDIVFEHQLPQDVEMSRLAGNVRGNMGDVWYSTGLYALPGKKITITIPEHLKNNLKVQIGAHNQRLFPQANVDWKRMPYVIAKKELDHTVTEVAGAFGGLVYLVCTEKTPAISGHIQIQGAVAAPYYVSGRTSDADWTNMLKNNKAPWGELETERLILTLPIPVLQEIDSPRHVAALWDSIVGSIYELGCLPSLYFRKQRIIPDIQLSAKGVVAAGVSGYPIGFLYDPGKEKSLDVLIHPERIGQAPPDYMGFAILHELGHNAQNKNVEFGGLREVTNNLYAWYVYDSIFKSRAGLWPSYADFSRDLLMTEDLSDWIKNPRLGLLMFQLLQKDFGWEPFRSVFGRFNADSMKGLVFSEQEKVDCWVLYLSEAVKKNLVPYFDKWGVKASDQVRRAVGQYPGWMPLAVSRY